MYRIAVTNRLLCQGDFLTRVEQLAKGEKYQAILLREKDLTEPEYEKLAAEVLAITSHYGKKCILHSFAGVAEKLRHPYVHLPLSIWGRIPVEKRQKMKHFFQKMGTSVHSEKQLREAEALGSDYVFAGHIFTTNCKKGLAPRGLDFLREICDQSSVPVYGIGGITGEREEAVIRQGAAGVCIMSGCMRD